MKAETAALRKGRKPAPQPITFEALLDWCHGRRVWLKPAKGNDGWLAIGLVGDCCIAEAGDTLGEALLYLREEMDLWEDIAQFAREDAKAGAGGENGNAGAL
ncbi:MAG: hypothetical protein GXY76_16455 [Chloroflexi bacterium]|nr:hypothetical protein [Chloroflexota bacterium]